MLSITLRAPVGQVMLGRWTRSTKVYDLRDDSAWRMIMESLDTLASVASGPSA